MGSIGILGGTFDPVHSAHLAMARAALDQLGLQKVLFIPTGEPRYRRPAFAASEHRVAMLELAIAGEPRCEVDTRELAPGASSYTADTLMSLERDFPGCELVLLMGADQYAKLSSWHRPDEVRRRAQIAVFARPGTEMRDSPSVVHMPPMKVSASEIRARAARGEDLAGMVPAAVANYIARHRLYR